MAEINEIFTRLQLKHDTYAAWDAVKNTFRPLPGEICVVEIPSGNTAATTAPTVLFKVGQAKNSTENYTFAELPWASALAADVYSWAKKTEAEFLAWVKGLVPVEVIDNGTGKFVTDITATSDANGHHITITRDDAVNTLTAAGDGVILLTVDKNKGDVTITGEHKEYGGSGETTDTDGDATTAGSSITIKVPTLKVDDYGHTEFTGETSHTITIPSEVAVGSGDITIEAGEGLAEGGTFNVNQDADDTITLKHAVPTGATEGEHSATTKGNLLKSVTTDKFGHIVSTDETALTFDLSESLSNGTDLQLRVGTDLASGIRFEGENGINVYGTSDYTKIMVDGSELKTAIGNNTSAIATLNGNDTGKSARAIATEVAKAEIGSAGHLKREIVTELPDVADADPDTIYMIKSFVNYEYIGTGEVGDDGILELGSATTHVYGVTALPGTRIVARSGVNYVKGTVYVQVDGNKYAPTGVSFECHSDDSPCFIDLPNGPVENSTYVIITDANYIQSIEPAAEGDQYTEFILIDDSLVQIGSTSVDLTSYVTEDELSDKLGTLSLLYSVEEGKYVTTVTQTSGKIKVYRKQISYNELADVPTNHKIQQTPVSNQQLSGANIVEGVSQTANGEITVHSRTLTPADIGAQPAGNYKTTQSEVTKTGSTVKTVTSVKQNANGEITEVKFEDIAFPALPTASGAATIATVANDVVTLKAGAVLNENHTLANNASADITLAKVAKTGSIYDVKEGTNDNKGSDKEAHPKYLIFNCGTSTKVI